MTAEEHANVFSFRNTVESDEINKMFANINFIVNRTKYMQNKFIEYNSEDNRRKAVYTTIKCKIILEKCETLLEKRISIADIVSLSLIIESMQEFLNLYK